MGGYQFKPTTTTLYIYDSNVYKEYSHVQILLKLSWGWEVWKLQGGMFNEKYCINLGTNEKKYDFTYVALIRANNFSQIALILAMA